tara:strand:- start:48 stop:302 length:255 start_codon:yes stop_codon:yes gene_type:complete
MNKSEILKKKLIYRSLYRGTKEMDILLSSFVKTHIDKFSYEELKDLDEFLDLEDEVIYNFYQNNISNDFLKKNKVSIHLKKFKI